MTTCCHCLQPITWVQAPPRYQAEGYPGYWYHTASQVVHCYPDDEQADQRAEP